MYSISTWICSVHVWASSDVCMVIVGCVLYEIEGEKGGMCGFVIQRDHLVIQSDDIWDSSSLPRESATCMSMSVYSE